ncbi:MAG TPA: BlaI/MecI/CopY family transcriptional regulator [Tepidisphaeraceae bacterium]|jgi:predicted transcriptional regulator
MPREPQDVTEAELAILQCLWKDGPQNIRQLTDALHPQNDASTYATVKKQLDRMGNKGLVLRDRSVFIHVFTAAVGREDLVGRGLEALAEKFCEGSFAPIFGLLGKSKPLTSAERKALRALLDDSTPIPKSRRDRKD